MAIIKNKVLENGTEGNYWIAETTNLKRNNKTQVMVLLYKDKATREAGKEFLVRENVGIMEGVYHTGSEVYTFIKRSILTDIIDPETHEVTGQEETNWFFDAKDDI